MNPGPWGILIIALVVLLLFGRGKIGSLMGEVAGGIKAFRKGLAEDEQATAEIENNRAREAAPPPPDTTATGAVPPYSEVREPERRDA